MWSVEDLVRLRKAYDQRSAERAAQMTRFWRLVSGLAVLVLALFASVSMVLNLTLGERPLLSLAYRVLLLSLACVVIFFSFAGSYLLLRDARNSK